MTTVEIRWEEGLAIVVLDGYPQSAVDPADPERLAFEYVQHMAMAIDVVAPVGPLRVTQVGGGGLTLARWLTATRPEATQIVLEPDAALTERIRRELPLPRAHRIRIRPVDGRTGLAGLRRGSADLVLLDAFANGRVPGGLVTAEAMAELAEVLRPGGVLVANLADEPDLRWFGRVHAGVGEVLPHTACVALHEVLKGRRFGNLVLVAGAQPLPVAELRRAAASQPLPTGVLDGPELRRRAPGARPFTDADPKPSPAPPDPGAWRRR